MRLNIITKLLLTVMFSFLLSLLVTIFPNMVLTRYIMFRAGDISPFQYNLLSFVIITIGIIVFILSFWLFTQKKIKYIQYMVNRIKEITNGDLGLTVEVRGKDEIADIAVNINALSTELKIKFDQEREIEEKKNELITNISHDLRTPLTSISGYLRLVKDSNYTSKESLEEYIEIAYSKSVRLQQLIDQLFEYTKLTSKGYNLNKINLDLKEMLEQLLEEMSYLAEEKGLTFKKNLPVHKLKIVADPRLLIRVFENILSNAIKYSTKPGIIELDLINSSDQEVIVIFRNKGESVSEGELTMMFERFYKGDKSRSTDSTGLGLAIAKSIVELHDGEIWAENKNDMIEFKVKLPMY